MVIVKNLNQKALHRNIRNALKNLIIILMKNRIILQEQAQSSKLSLKQSGEKELFIEFLP